MRTVWRRDYITMALLAALVGILSAAGAILFRYLINGMSMVFMGATTPLEHTRGYLIVALPAIGGLIVGLLVYFLASEAKGHGVPEVMEAIHMKGGRIRPRVIFVKALASSITLGSGGSAGREGPIVQIGSALGSTLAQRLKLPTGAVKVLLACGAAGGIAATFNTPISGVIFSMELILMEFKTFSFIPLVISSVTATTVSRAVLGNYPAFIIPAGAEGYQLVSPYEYAFYLILAVVLGVAGVLFVKLFYFMEDVFDGMKMPPYIKPVLGGIVVGCIGLAVPNVLSVGYDTVEMALENRIGVYMLLFLFLFKLFSTSFTLGSGHSGGVFSPSLFMGAMLGGFLGAVFHSWFPDITATSGSYAIVGMGAFFAAVSRATFTSVIIIFEMTLNYNLILPLLLSCVISDAVSVMLMKDTIYTRKLSRRGVRIIHNMEANVLEAMQVKDAMIPVDRLVTVTPDKRIKDVFGLLTETEHMGFPVVEKGNRVCGMVTFHDVHLALKGGNENAEVGRYCSRKLITVTPNTTLDKAMYKMSIHDISHLPVVDPEDSRKLLGMITKGDIMKSYTLDMLTCLSDDR